MGLRFHNSCFQTFLHSRDFLVESHGQYLIMTFKVFLERLSFGSLAFAGWPFSYSANCLANYLRINPEP